MSQHMYHSGKKMRKILVVPPKVGKILKIGKMKYMKTRPNIKKLTRKKEVRKRMMEIDEESTAKKDFSESEEAHPSNISRNNKSCTSLGEKFDSAGAKCIDSTEEKVQSDGSSETREYISDCSLQNLNDSDDGIGLHEDNADIESSKQNEDENDSDCVVITNTNSIVDENPNNVLNYLPNDTSLSVQEAKAEFHHLSDKSYLLIIRHPGQLYFRGTLSVTPVSGITSFLGYEFSPGMKSHLVFSPKGISPLFFSTTGQSSHPKQVSKISGIDENILKRLGKKDSGLLIEPASGDHWMKLSGFFNHYLNFNPLAPPKTVTRKTDVDVEIDLGVELLQPSECVSSRSFHRESSEWNKLSQEIRDFALCKDSVRVMVFGGKGVGKSTFMRFLVNQWLTYFDKSKNSRDKNGTILFLDFDPGQSEFVPPGCVSVTLVSEPLLGPNYTHLQDPERMVCLGELDVSRCPKWYLYCVDDLVNFCSSEKFSGVPWFINTMGFCKGIGADLAVELIKLCRPTHVIQLTSIWARRNFLPLNLLSWKMVKTWRGQKWNPHISGKIDSDIPEYSYHQLQSLAECSEKAGKSHSNGGGIEDIDSQWGLPAWQSRELCILAYFSKIVKAPKFSILDAVPYTLRLPDVVFSLPSAMVKSQYVKSVFNATLVGLVRLGKEYGGIQEPDQERIQDVHEKKPWLKFEDGAVDPKVLFHMPLAPCYGFGLVRGIDDSKKEVYVTTPLSSEAMFTIDCLATGPKIGAIPAPMMMDSLKKSRQKDAPYLRKKDRRTNMNRFAPRVFQPHLANPGAKRSKP